MPGRTRVCPARARGGLYSIMITWQPNGVPCWSESLSELLSVDIRSDSEMAQGGLPLDSPSRSEPLPVDSQAVGIATGCQWSARPSPRRVAT